jgi:hypothetical protein
MGDVLFVGIAVVSFLLLWAFARGCEVLRRQ